MYCASMMPGSASETTRTPMAVGTVPASASMTKSQSPRNLPATTSSSVSGCARSHSSVLLRRSSASVRIVAAGTKIAKRIGSRSKIGRKRCHAGRVHRAEGEKERNPQKGYDQHVSGRLIEIATKLASGDGPDAAHHCSTSSESALSAGPSCVSGSGLVALGRVHCPGLVGGQGPEQLLQARTLT